MKKGSEAATGCVLYRKVFLKIPQNSQENTCARVSFNFIEKETLTQMFPCEFYKVFENTFFKEHLKATASGICIIFMTFLVESNVFCFSLL